MTSTTNVHWNTYRTAYVFFSVIRSEDFDPYTPETHAMVLSRAQLVYGRLGLEMPPVPELPESLALDRQD